jgi:hypothetical protein
MFNEEYKLAIKLHARQIHDVRSKFLQGIILGEEKQFGALY